jgi:hypothetical protein
MNSLLKRLMPLAMAVAACGLYACSPVGNSSCDGGEICMWSDDSYGGCINDLVPPNEDGNYTNGTPNWDNCEGHMNDAISSYSNRSNSWIKWYYDDGFSGYTFCAAPGSSTQDLSNFFAVGPGSPEDDFTAHATSISQPSGCTFTDSA